MPALAAGKRSRCSAHAPPYTARSLAFIIVTITIIISTATTSSSSIPAFAAAQPPPPPPNPWRLMMEDTKTVFLLLHNFPDTFSLPPADRAAPAAVALASGLVSLKTRNSNLCTAAYGGYNGASALMLSPILSIL